MKDLLDLIKALGIGLNEETKPIINDFIEKSNEEKIPFEDFLNLYDLLNQYKKSKEEEEQELLKAFEFFDGEGSGFIDVNYFKKAITCFGDKISEEDFNNLIQQVIMDNTNKKFDYKDLAQIILGMKK
jgi:Ca2+-binding EF-hand superfamily protein